MIKLNKKEFTDEDIQKLIDNSTSIREILIKCGMKGCGANHTKLKKYIFSNKFDTHTLVGRKLKRYSNKGVHRKKLSELLILNGTGNSSKLKERLIKCGIKEYKCEKCGNTEYDGEIIPLELHHINGDHYDNRLENLVLLCPICHYRTTNFRGKNEQYDKELKDVASKNVQEKLNLLKEKENIEEQVYRLRKMARGEISSSKQGVHRTQEIEVKVCKNCGKEFIGRGKYFCSVECMNDYQRNNKYNKEDILEKSKTCHSLIELGKLYNITDNGIKKQLKRLNILDEVKNNFKKNIKIKGN